MNVSFTLNVYSAQKFPTLEHVAVSSGMTLVQTIMKITELVLKLSDETHTYKEIIIS